MASEPTNASPSAWPSASGEPRRAATIRSPWPSKRNRSAKAPSSRSTTAIAASSGARPAAISRAVSAATTSVSVSLSNSWPSASARSARQFSTMPLWTTATGPDAVGVGVDDARRAVGRPAGVADPGAAGQGVGHQEVGQLDELAHGSAAGEPALVHGGDPGAVVAAVFEAPERVDQDRRGLVPAEVAHDAAHLRSPWRARAAAASARARGRGWCAGARAPRRARPPARRG